MNLNLLSNINLSADDKPTYCQITKSGLPFSIGTVHNVALVTSNLLYGSANT